MSVLNYGANISIYYETWGDGFPLLLFAPGGMRSAINFWKRSPWNPIEHLKSDFRVIAMDQRNAGRSSAPINRNDGWHSYTDDHLALLDHLGIKNCHLMGGCIGGPYCFGLIERAGDRISGAVIQQTIGLDNNRQAFYEMFDSWAVEILKKDKSINLSVMNQFRSNMYDGEFLFNVDSEFIANCPVPLLVLMGNDLYHPQSISRKIANLAPRAQLLEHWKEPENIVMTIKAVTDFLKNCEK